MEKGMKGVVVTIDLKNGIEGDKKDKVGQDAPASYETAIVACGFGRFNYLLMLSLIPMTAAQLFSSGSMGFVLPNAQCELELDDFQKGTLNGATYLGNLMSGLVWGGVSDMFGRRKIVFWCFFVDFFVSVACSFAHSYWVLLVLKCLAGVIIAGPNSLLYAYLAEVHDDKHRTMAIMATGLGFSFCQVLQPLLAYALLPLEFSLPLVPGPGGMTLTSWRVFFLVCALPSLVSGLCFLPLPESPKFLMSRGRQAEALQVFRGIYAANTGNAPDTYPVKSLEMPLTPKALEGEGQQDPSRLKQAMRQFAPLFRKPYLSRILLLIIIQINVMICINALRLWTPTLFALIEQYDTSDWPSRPPATTVCQMITAVIGRQQFLDASAANESAAVALGALGADASAAVGKCGSPVSGDVYVRSIIIGCVGTSSFLITGWASKRCGNRPLVLFSFPKALLSAIAMIWAVNSDMFMGLLAVFTPTASIGLTALSAITVNLFPTSLRGVSVSLTLLSGRAASLSGNIILPFLLNISCEALFIFLAACLSVCSVLVWFIPKKKEGEAE